MRFMFDITDTESHFLKQFYLGLGIQRVLQFRAVTGVWAIVYFLNGVI